MADALRGEILDFASLLSEKAANGMQMVVCMPKEKFTQKKPAAFDQEICRKKMTISFYPHKLKK